MQCYNPVKFQEEEEIPMHMNSYEMHHQVQDYPVSVSFCSDFSVTSAHAAFSAVCAFFVIFAGSLLAASSFAALLLPLGIILSILISILICSLIIRQNKSLRRQSQFIF